MCIRDRITPLEREKDQAQQLVKHAWELRAHLLNMYVVLSSAESATRNFGLTGEEEGIQPLGMVGPTIDGVFDKMSGLILDSPAQAQRLAQFRQRVHLRLDGIKKVHEFYEAHNADHASPPSELVELSLIHI